MTLQTDDNIAQVGNAEFLALLKQHLITDSFGYEQFPEQKQLLQLAIDFYFPLELGWQQTCLQLATHRDWQKTTYAREWLDHLLDFYALYLFWSKKVSLHALFSLKLFEPSRFLLFLRKQITKNFMIDREKVDSYFSQIINELNYHDISVENLSADLKPVSSMECAEHVYLAGLPELEPRSVIKFSETIRSLMSNNALPIRKKFQWRSWKAEYGYWKMFFVQIVALAILTFCLFWGIKVINHYYEKIIIEKITLLEPNFLWLDTKLTFKNESDIPQKEIKLSSTQIDELEKFERVEQTKLQVTEFLPESDIIDTSVAIGGWRGTGGFGEEFLGTDEDTPNMGKEYRDIYDGFSKSYRLMLNTADLFDMRQKLIAMFRSYGVKEAAIPMVGKESLDGVYFNVYIPTNKIQNFISDVTNMEITNTYISKTSFRPPAGYERVFIWVKKI